MYCTVFWCVGVVFAIKGVNLACDVEYYGENRKTLKYCCMVIYQCLRMAFTQSYLMKLPFSF